MKDKSPYHGSLQPMIEAIRDNYEKIIQLKNASADIDMTEAAVMSIIDTLGYTETQAQEVVDDLRNGIENYGVKRKALEENSTSMEESIRESLASYSQQERKDILVNTLTALQLNTQAGADKNVESLRAANASLSEDDLIHAVMDSLDGLPFVAVIDAVGTQLDNETLGLLDNMREAMTDDHRLATAVEIYIAQQQGLLSLGEDGTKLAPELIGAMTGAAIDAINATNDLHNDRIDLTTWQRILKWILGSLFLLIMCALSATIILSVGVATATLLFYIFGAGILTQIVSAALMFILCVKYCDVHDKMIDASMEKMSGIYDKVITMLTDKLKSLLSKISSPRNKQNADNQSVDNINTADDTDTSIFVTDGNNSREAPALA